VLALHQEPLAWSLQDQINATIGAIRGDRCVVPLPLKDSGHCAFKLTPRHLVERGPLRASFIAHLVGLEAGCRHQRQFVTSSRTHVDVPS
jgi:hypothetical protein